LEHSPFLALLLITVLAFLVPLFARRLRRIRLPIVVGEIFTGIVIGKSALNLVEPSTTLTFLAEFGFVYLMFLSGLEVDYDLMSSSVRAPRQHRSWRGPVPLAILSLMATLTLSYLGAIALSRLGVVENPVLMGLILSTTSLGVVVPVLKERRILNQEYGQYLLAAASIADFATLLLVTIAIAVRSHGLTLDLLLIPVLLLLFLLAARASQRFGSIPVVQRVTEELSSATAQLRVRGAFALMTGWVVLAEALGVELILGAFMAGAIAGLIEEGEESSAREKLDAIGYGFFIPIFFIMVGVEFNLQALLQSRQAILLTLLLTLIAFLVKILPATVFRFKFPWRESLAGGVLLSSRLSLIIAAAAIALDIGAINEATNAAVILLAIVSCTLAPTAFHRLYPEREEARREGIIIVGADQMAEMLADRLKPAGEPVTVLCADRSREQAFKEMDIPVITECPDMRLALEQAGGAQARILVDLTSSNEATLEVCTLAREAYSIPLVISRISEVEMLPKLQQLGVKVVQPALATAMALEGALRYPSAFDVLLHRAEEVEVNEVPLTNVSLLGLPLSKVRMPGNALILSVQRDGTVMVPESDTVLEQGDLIGLIGSKESVQQAASLLRG
jgi:Kef-type K+ transport system membrane component KefB/Trk K+ transport system NAD-binding subunit